MTFITSPINGVKSTNNSTTSNIGGQTTLNENLSDSDTTAITLVDASSFPTSGTIKIESEYITYTNKSSNDLTGTITRGAFNTTAAAHTLGTAVIGVYVGTSELNSQPDVMITVLSDQNSNLYLDFSDDNTNWESFPSLGYDVTSNTYTMHTAVKGTRYFRTRLESNSVSGTSSLQINTYYGVFQQQIVPLDQPVTDNSDSTLSKAVITAKIEGGTYLNLSGSNQGHLNTRITEPLLPFGSIHTENLYPIYQIDAVYGINTDLVFPIVGNLTGGSSSATVTGTDNKFTCSTGTTAFSYSSLQTQSRLRYRAGQGVIARFTAIFSSPATDSILVAGIGTAEAGLFFGYNDTDFGILYSTGGVRESRLLTITAGATGTTNYTVTLNSINYVFPAVDTSGSTLITAREVANGDYGGDWRAEQRGSTVYFLAGTAGAKAGTYSFSHATATGTFGGSIQTGASPTDTWITQSNWNKDSMDGTGPSGVVLNPSNGNVFQIGMQYLGFGFLTFYIETLTGFNLVHTIEYPNTSTSSNLSQPSMPFTMAAYSSGSTTDVSVGTLSIAGFIEGQKVLGGPVYTYNRETNGFVSSAASTYYPFFTIRNSYGYSLPGVTERPNQSVINILSISCVHDDATPITFFLVKNANLQGPTDFQQFTTNSCTYWDIASSTNTINSNDQLLFSLQTGQQSGETIQFDDPILLQPGETITLCARAVTGTATWVNASLNTREDQ